MILTSSSDWLSKLCRLPSDEQQLRIYPCNHLTYDSVIAAMQAQGMNATRAYKGKGDWYVYQHGNSIYIQRNIPA